MYSIYPLVFLLDFGFKAIARYHIVFLYFAPIEQGGIKMLFNLTNILFV